MILGAILAGGASTRFGSDKALALLERRPLISHAHDAISGVVARVIVCGRAWGGLVSIDDLPHPGLGPLGGIAAALRYAEDAGFDRLLTISCDMPEAPATLLDALLEQAPSYCSDAPTLGHWPTGLSGALAHRIGHDGPNSTRSIRAWAADIGATPIPSPTPLRNINRPSDLAA